MGEQRYTLEEARRQLAAEECLVNGHDTEQLVDPSTADIVGLLCSRCGRGWKVTPVGAEPDRELLIAAADDARILAQHRGDDADAEKYGALWRQLAGVRVGVTGEPPREAERRQAEEEGRCMTPLYKPERTPKQGRGFPGPREVEAICFLEAGHHGSHRSERGHIWS